MFSGRFWEEQINVQSTRQIVPHGATRGKNEGRDSAREAGERS
jgi:hypothetical protein